jgi:hypothetical protein
MNLGTVTNIKLGKGEQFDLIPATIWTDGIINSPSRISNFGTRKRTMVQPEVPASLPPEKKQTGTFL